MPWPIRLGPPPRIMIFLPGRGHAFVFVLVGGVVVRRVCLELGRACVNELIRRRDAELPALFPDGKVVGAEQAAQLHVRKAVLLRLCQNSLEAGLLLRQHGRGQRFFKFDDFAHVVEEPRVDAGGFCHVGDRHALVKSVPEQKDAVGARERKALEYLFLRGFLARDFLKPLFRRSPGRAGPSAAPP